LIITAATFTTGLLQTGGDTHHRWFVLRTVGEMIFTAGSCYVPVVKMGRIFTAVLCYEPAGKITFTNDLTYAAAH